jgi:hypothetical protein
MGATVTFSLLSAAPLLAYDYSFSGESTTILRMRTTTDKKTLLPAYEYLRLNMTDDRSDGSAVSFNLSTWGRKDLADASTATDPDGDLQYAYLTYRAPKNNTIATIGRQFVSEGVATERLDGVYARNDFAYGIGASAYFGNSVITESNYPGGTLIYGTRISQTDKKYYTVGLSMLESDREDGSLYRQEEGVDLWLRPHDSVDITGRSSYNSITNGWMESSFSVVYVPLTALRLGADYSHVNFTDYLAGMTTSALSLVNPVWKSNEEQTAVGANVGYTGFKDLSLSADFKFYSYDQSGDATYFGGKAVYQLPDALVVGAALHRMEGYIDRLRYLEFRTFASKKIGKVSLAADLFNVNYDKSVNSVTNSIAVTASGGYEFNRKLKVGADLEFSRNPDFDREVRALVKATYTFDTKFAAEGGTKSEK